MKKPVPLATDDDAELNQLIAGGRLSGSEYDRVEQRVLEHAAASPTPDVRVAARSLPGVLLAALRKLGARWSSKK
jgi:hypothetical protein